MDKKHMLHLKQFEQWYPPQFLRIHIKVTKNIIASDCLCNINPGIKITKKLETSAIIISIPYLYISISSKCEFFCKSFIKQFDR